ncbi:hypothetical protein AB0A05_35540 [Streptomyces sp. NPDC046374]|uniref:hypothetical protein n=1 Tax=Streptomyces sp. NPDC046374 TaxID=3154917 RepID=UPI0033C92C20
MAGLHFDDLDAATNQALLAFSLGWRWELVEDLLERAVERAGPLAGQAPERRSFGGHQQEPVRTGHLHPLGGPYGGQQAALFGLLQA